MVTAVYFGNISDQETVITICCLSWPIFCWKSVQNPAYNREQCFLAMVGEVSEWVF